MSGTSSDKPTTISNRYSLDFDGLHIIEFTEVTGMSIECKSVDLTFAHVASGGTGLYTYPGVVSYGDLTLKMGKIVDSSEFFTWLQQVVDANFRAALRTGSIVQLPPEIGSDQFEGERWNFTDAWPTKWELATSGAGQSSVVVETLTLKIGTIVRDG